MGVGILRQASREAFSKLGIKHSTIKDALNHIQQNLKIPVTEFTQHSVVLKEYGKQKKISSFFES